VRVTLAFMTDRGSDRGRVRNSVRSRRESAFRKDWIVAYGTVCAGYRREQHYVHPRDLQVDHVKPQRRGHAAEGADGPLQMLCRSCNMSKGVRKNFPVQRQERVYRHPLVQFDCDEESETSQ